MQIVFHGTHTAEEAAEIFSVLLNYSVNAIALVIIGKFFWTLPCAMRMVMTLN